jgi:hypothetical protein
MEKQDPPFHRMLKEYQDLQTSVHRDLEKVWQIDSSGDNPEYAKERTEIIERVFYKIANEWLGGENFDRVRKLK